MIDRRVFLRDAYLMGAATSLLGTGCARPASAPAPATRYVLEEAGPMLPPVPAVLLTVDGRPGDPEEISVLWSFVINGSPPQVGVSAARGHVAGDLIRLHGQFVLNVPTARIVEAFDIVDMSSDRVDDKFALAGLTSGRATAVQAPTVAEAPVHVECEVFDVIEVPPVRTVFLADVLATTVLEGTCDDAGRLLVDSVDFFGMTAGSGEFYTMGRRVGHIGMSVGRDDIKY